MISVYKPMLPTLEELSPYLRRIDDSYWYTNRGPLVRELEQRLEHRWESNYVTTVSNATAGLTLALQALHLTPGSTVIVPSWTFTATALAVISAGLTPYFVDVEYETQLPRKTQVRELVKADRSAVQAMIVVCPFGAPINSQEWENFAEELGIQLVFDAAAAFDSWKPTKSPTVISFHATKILPAGEGGAILSNDEHYIAEVQARSNFGFKGSRYSKFVGQNAKMSEYHAAIGLSSLDQYTTKREQYCHLAEQYKETLEKHGINFDREFGDTWIATTYNIVCDTSGRYSMPEIKARFSHNQIETRNWWESGCHKMKAFDGYPVVDDMSNTQRLSACLLGIPFHLDVDVNNILDILVNE